MQTANETKIIDMLRTLKPFERIEIVADANGKPGYFLVTRTSKMVLAIDNKYIK